jgi:leucyl/phenylalanyl-tRNA--protein transferase
MFIEATPDLFLQAYRQGIFPMAEEKEAPWYSFYAPHQRALLPILNLHIPRRLARQVRQEIYDVRVNTAFDRVIDDCAEIKKPDRQSTWINQIIRDCFIELHEGGHAHSVEVWQDEKLVGGLYGLAIGAVFCGESMFSRADNASKIALVHLVARLYQGGFHLLDSQFANTHLMQFGLYEMPQEKYVEHIQIEMEKEADFFQTGRSEPALLRTYWEARKKT